MALSAALTTHLHALSAQIATDEHQRAAAVGALTCDVTEAVASYLGLELVLLNHGYPWTLTSFEPSVQRDRIATSLRLRLSVLHVPDADPDSTITFYAGTPGAFVDLAADLSYATSSTIDSATSRCRQSAAAVSVDDRRQPTTVQSGLAGGADLSTINRAIGFLIGHGCHPDEAHAELRRLAADDDVTVLVRAGQLLADDGGVQW